MQASHRKLSDRLPEVLRPVARSLGREQLRARLAVVDVLLHARVIAQHGVRHLAGPTDLRPGPTELVVLCLVRNGAAHLPTFLRYYERLGARHIVLLDNASTDDTLELARGATSVTLLSTELPFGRYEIALKRWLVRRFGSGGGWCLVADMDELFDYPFSSRLPVASFLAYLNAHGYNAVTAQNLEMIPRESIAEIQGRQELDLESSHRHYDLSDIRQVRNQFWLDRNELDCEGHYTHTGGIWETIFGYQGSKLTKQPLLRPAGSRMKVFPYDIHFVADARIADVTGVFRHYKYTGRFVEHVREELERRQHYGRAEIFEHYARVLEANPELSLYRSTAREYFGAEDLLESGFLLASARYMRWVAEHGTAAPEPRMPGQ